MKTINNVTYILVTPTDDSGCANCAAHGDGAMCNMLQSLDCLMGTDVWAVESDPDRDAIEDACVIKFAAWREDGNSSNDNGCELSREALCWRLDNGEYGVAALNGAWWGWQQGRAWRG